MSSKKFTAQTFAWLQLLKSDRDTTALAVGVQLTTHFNEKDEGGRAWPGCKFMAVALGMSESTVVRAVHRMHERGRLRVEWGKQGRGHPNNYWMIVKPAPAQVSEPIKPAPAQVSRPGKPAPAPAVKPAPAPRKPAPAHMNLSKNHGAGRSSAPCAGGDRSSLSLDDDPGDGGPDGPSPGRKKTTALAVVEPDRFAPLWTAWERPGCFDDEDDARRAHALACLETTPDQIDDGPRVWMKARGPGFLPPLAKWLRGQGWKKPPGNFNAKPPKRSNADAMADKLHDEDAA